MKILIVGNKNRFIHLEEFGQELEKSGVTCKIIHDLDFIQKTTKMDLKGLINKKKEMNKLLEDFCPDLIVLDRITKINKIFLKSLIYT